MVWRHNKTTGKRGWTGPGVIIAISQTKTSFWIHMRGSLLKCSGEQVRKATDAEYLGTELVKVLSQELLKSRERSGQRGYVDVEVEGNPDEEPPEDTRPDVRDVVGVPSSSDISGDLRGQQNDTDTGRSGTNARSTADASTIATSSSEYYRQRRGFCYGNTTGKRTISRSQQSSIKIDGNNSRTKCSTEDGCLRNTTTA